MDGDGDLDLLVNGIAAGTRLAGAPLEEIIARGLYEKKDSPAEFYVDSDSLRQRGINSEDLVEGLEPIAHEKIADLMASHPLQMIF